jgi:hypothetical protein
MQTQGRIGMETAGQDGNGDAGRDRSYVESRALEG